ncbi:hypothetical protein KAX01_03955 [Candidatus Bathyarchaeota archaeon]|nr:hypothetical protein [Candidatus Bathyarchaeota archaeon]
MPASSTFPKRVYTVNEVGKARKLVESGYKHRVTIKGNPDFKREAKEALKHVKTARFYDSFRTYIREIVEIDGFSQLRETEAAIWVNGHLLRNSVEAAGFFVQKAFQMREFLEGKLYYGGAAEARNVDKRIEFLNALRKWSKNPTVKDKSGELLEMWAESASSVGP